MGELNTIPMRINGVEGAAGQVKLSGGPGVLETWGTPAPAAHTHAAGDVTSGQFPLARMPRAAAGNFLEGAGVGSDPIYNALVSGDIPNLDTAKITTGTFADGRIPNLNASKINAGQFPLARMPRAAAGSFLEGNGVGADPIFNALIAGDIPNLAASKITSGQFPLARMPRGTDNYVVAGTGAGSDPVYELVTDAHVAAANKDGAAGTASMRTLGSGAQQAAPGNHTHTLAEDVIGSEESALVTLLSDYGYMQVFAVVAGGDYDLVAKTLVFAATSRAVAVASIYTVANQLNGIKLRLYMGGVQVAETGFLPLNTPYENYILVGTRALSGSQECKLGFHNYSGLTRGCNCFSRIEGETIIATIGVGSIKL